MFGLQPLVGSTSQLVLDVYERHLDAEEHALALCQLATQAARYSWARAMPFIQALVKELPRTGHLWAHIVAPQLVQTLVQAGEQAAANSLLFQSAGAARAAPHASAADAVHRLRLAANSVRLDQRQLLAAYRSAREAVEAAGIQGTPGEICSHLLCLADIHLEARDPVAALGPCMRCLSAAESAHLLDYRAEALVRIARVKFEMHDLLGALQLAEEVTPQLAASGSARSRGDALMVQVDVLFALADHSGLERQRLLKAITELLVAAAGQFQAVAEVNSLQRCHYLLARSYHQLGDEHRRDTHAKLFRMLSDLQTRRAAVTWSQLGQVEKQNATSVPERHSTYVPGANLQELRAKCPSLARMLDLTEAAPSVTAADTNASTQEGGWPRTGLFGAMSCAEDSCMVAEQTSRKISLVLGDVHGLYPITASLRL